jgi:hypothetical protein
VWIDLLIVELGFNNFWGFSMDWPVDCLCCPDPIVLIQIFRFWVPVCVDYRLLMI